MKIVVLIPDGMGIRNFVLSPFLNLLAERAETVVWHVFSGEAAGQLRTGLNPAVRWEPLPSFREGVGERLTRLAKVGAQLYWQKLPLTSAFRLKGSLLNQAFVVSARELARLHGSPSGLARLDRLHWSLTARAGYLKPFTEFLEREKPGAVFCTHQRSSRAVPAMIAARELGIPTATFIYSWDNLPKGRMPVYASHYVVWSDWMKQEMLRYYPEVAPERSHIVGTPQFEFYFDPSLRQPREEFLAAHGLRASHPVVCFSGCDLATSPHDPLYLRDTAAALREFPESERPQLLFRPCPTDSISRFRPVLSAFPEIAVSQPAWVRYSESDWQQVAPSREDLRLLVNTSYHADLVVNYGSTMAVDFAVADNPSIFVDYSPEGSGGWDPNTCYQLPHFRLIEEAGLVDRVRHPGEMAAMIRHVLANRAERRERREQCVRMISAQPMDQASRRCVDTLMRIAAGR